MHKISGMEPKAHLPEPAILLVVITTAFGVGLGALGGRRRDKRHQRERELEAATATNELQPEVHGSAVR